MGGPKLIPQRFTNVLYGCFLLLLLTGTGIDRIPKEKVGRSEKGIAWGQICL